jgi:hypothetical protein
MRRGSASRRPGAFSSTTRSAPGATT